MLLAALPTLATLLCDRAGFFLSTQAPCRKSSEASSSSATTNNDDVDHGGDIWFQISNRVSRNTREVSVVD